MNTALKNRYSNLRFDADASWVGGNTIAPSCVFLTFDEAGLIVEDHSYTDDPAGAAENDARNATG